MARPASLVVFSLKIRLEDGITAVVPSSSRIENPLCYPDRAFHVQCTEQKPHLNRSLNAIALFCAVMVLFLYTIVLLGEHLKFQ
ncbi:MAG: hypothetical protein AB1847_11830 [bacterium]